MFSSRSILRYLIPLYTIGSVCMRRFQKNITDMELTMITHLPNDIMFDIFSRIPAKTLLRLKIICKSWYSIITNNYFINRHLQRSLLTNTNLHFLITTPQFYLQDYAHLPQPYRQTCPALNSADFDTLQNPYELSHPYKLCNTGVGVIGTCRGLVLLRCGKDSLLLYNPTTQTYNVLPPLCVCQLSLPESRVNYGIGYDSVAKDYKVVRIISIIQFTDKFLGYLLSEVMVYSFGTNCWKRVEDVPRCLNAFSWDDFSFVRETFHWVGVKSDGVFETIIAFSLRDETFSCLPLPDSDFDHTSDGLYMGVLDDCLCLLANRYLHCNVWVMKEYGVARSWTRMYCFEKLQCTNLERPVTYSIDRKRLFFSKSLSELGYINLETKEHGNVKFADWDRGLNAHVYVENLLMLDYAEFVDDIRSEKEQHGKSKKKKNRRRRRNKK